MVCNTTGFIVYCGSSGGKKQFIAKLLTAVTQSYILQNTGGLNNFYLMCSYVITNKTSFVFHAFSPLLRLLIFISLISNYPRAVSH